MSRESKRPMATPSNTSPASWHFAVLGLIASVLGVFLGANDISVARAEEGRHAIAMHGEPALPAGFTELRYANPAAPKGGRLVQGWLGTSTVSIRSSSR